MQYAVAKHVIFCYEKKGMKYGYNNNSNNKKGEREKK
jgi:hypothetical protein